MKYQIQDREVIIDCEHSIKMDAIEAHMHILEKVLTYGKPIVFDAKQMNGIDTAGLQLLLSFILAVEEKQLIWRWQAPSYQLIQGANALGMQALLKLPIKE